MTQPTITDAYWFAYAQRLVDAAVASREEAAEKLRTLLAWFWTVYTTLLAVGAALVTKNYPETIKVLLAAPVVVVPLAYWLCTQVQMPVDVGFDPRRPADIRAAYVRAVKTKRRWLLAAQILAWLSAVTLAVAFFLTSTYAETKPEPPKAEYLRFGIQFAMGRGYVTLDANLPSVTVIEVTLAPIKPPHPPILVSLRAKEGAAVAAMRLPLPTETVRVAARYEQRGRTITIEEMLRVPRPVPATIPVSPTAVPSPK